MIMERFTIQIKPGKFDEALELTKDGRKNLWPFFSARIYSCNWGTLNTLLLESDFEDMVEHDKLWEQLWAKEGWSAYMTKLNELIDGPYTHTLWTIE